MLQLSTAVRNEIADSIETVIGTEPILKILTGTAPANPAASETGTVLVEFELPSDWLTSASNGTKTLNGLWSAEAIEEGTASYFRIYNSAGTVCHMQGSVSDMSGSGDLKLSSTALVEDQPVNFSMFTLTADHA